LLIDRATRIVPHLTAIELALHEATDEMPPGAILWTHRDDGGPDNDPTQRGWMERPDALFITIAIREALDHAMSV
jgi:hypothetical protein